MSVADLFERGFRRNRAEPLPIEGPSCAGIDGHAVRFSLAIADGRITGAGFRASSCATLIAYCEFVAEIIPGTFLDIARCLTPADLVEAVPGVPALKRDRAILAITGFRAALAAAQPSTGEASP
jgi:NifU-like protein involved in Fe-S cluster formation